MGAYGSERTTQSLQDFPVADSEEEAEEVMGLGWATPVGCYGLCILMAFGCHHTQLGAQCAASSIMLP